MRSIAAIWRGLFPREQAAAPTTAIVAPVEPAKIPWGRIFDKLSALDDKPAWYDAPPTVTKLKLPDVLPGVRPKVMPVETTAEEFATKPGAILAFDQGSKEVLAVDNLPAAWGFPGASNMIGPGLAFLGFPYLAELVQITEYRTPSESLSDEMVRAWLKVINKGKGDKAAQIKQIEDRFEELKIRDLFREAALKTEQFGRAHLMVNVKGQDNDKDRQLPLTEIKKGELVGFTCVEAYWLTPYSWNATDPTRADFYKPQSWFVLGKKTHTSRILTFIFREVPDLLKPAYDFAGISITQLMMPYVNRWLRTAKNVNDLINIFSIVTLATDLQSLLQNPEDFVKRLQMFTQTRDNRGLMAINKSTEELGMQNVPLSSLDKLQAQAQEHMATPSRMPLIKFFGITPTGLGATSEGEFQAWYDNVHALQEKGFGPHMEIVLKLVQMDLFGKVDDEIGFEWQSMYEPTPKEESELRKADADRDQVYITASVVSADEVREKLQRDPKSGYNNLKGPAPEPPEMTEFALGEEGKDNDADRDEEAAKAAHGRSEESAEAAHARSEEAAKRDRVATPKPKPGAK